MSVAHFLRNRPPTPNPTPSQDLYPEASEPRYGYCTAFGEDTPAGRDLLARAGQPVAFARFVVAVAGLADWARWQGYVGVWEGLAVDTKVRYYRSTYRGTPCYFAALGGLYHLWCAPGRCPVHASVVGTPAVRPHELPSRTPTEGF